MHIRINDRFHPFTKTCGSSLLLPKTTVGVKIYPNQIDFFDFSTEKPQCIGKARFKFEGIARDFLAISDFEKQEIRVLMTIGEELFRYRIKAENQKICIDIKKQPHSFQLSYQEIEIKETKETPKKERLSFGIYKKQLWEKILDRGEVKEFLPLWFFAGQLSPQSAIPLNENSPLALLRDAKEGAAKKWTDLLRSSFAGIFCPTTQDQHHLGGFIPSVNQESPSLLLSQGYQLIRSFFIQEKGETLFLLPHLFKELAAGKIEVSLEKMDVQIEWRKYQIRRVILHSLAEQKINLELPEKIKSIRCRFGQEKILLKPPFRDIILKKNVKYYLDQFQI